VMLTRSAPIIWHFVRAVLWSTLSEDSDG